MQPGTVLRWDHFPCPKVGPIKARWFVVMARSGIFETPMIFHLNTTTSQVEYYQPGGIREKSPHFVLKKEKFPFLGVDCVIDFKLDFPEPYEESFLKKCAGNIEVKGTLDNQTLREIFNMMVFAGFVQKKTLKDVYASLENAGLKGLKKPK